MGIVGMLRTAKTAADERKTLAVEHRQAGAGR